MTAASRSLLGQMGRSSSTIWAAVFIDSQDIETILVLCELGQLATEDEQWLTYQLRVVHDPGLKLCLRNMSIETRPA